MLRGSVDSSNFLLLKLIELDHLRLVPVDLHLGWIVVHRSFFRVCARFGLALMLLMTRFELGQGLAIDVVWTVVIWILFTKVVAVAYHVLIVMVVETDNRLVQLVWIASTSDIEHYLGRVQAYAFKWGVTTFGSFGRDRLRWLWCSRWR